VSGLLTGRYPEELGILSNESTVPESVPTLATELAARGWRTGAVVGNFVLRRAAGLARGFDLFDDDFPQYEVVRHWPERIAEDTTRATLAMLDDCTSDAQARCFLWVHYQDPHGPYDPPPELRARFLAAERDAPDGKRRLPVGKDHSGIGAIPAYQYMKGHRDVGFYRAGYLAEIAYLDASVGRLIQGLRDRGLLEQALVVFAADHGESLGEAGVWFAHGEHLTDDQVRVPLLLRLPGGRGQRREDVVSLVDVFPTLLALLEGVPVDPDAVGRDLLAVDAAEQASRPYLATLGGSRTVRYGIIADGYKFVMSDREGVWDGALHPLGRDDLDLSPAAPQLAASMRKQLRAVRSRMERGAPQRPQALSDADRDKLRALGYLEEPRAR
jgi:arylsulfatase A-like enzyme